MRTVRAYWLGLILITRVSIAFAQQQQAVTPIPVLTDEDRAAAFSDVGTHQRKNALNYYVLFDRLEWASGNSERTANWDTVGWFGGDISRLWFRTEGAADRHAVRDAEAHLLYGRSFSKWWDFVAGVRQDFRPSPVQTWGAVGIQGLAPNFF